jgi:Peptidase family M23
MTNNKPQISGGDRTRTLFCFLFSVVALLFVFAGTPPQRAVAAGGEYQWPMKPFNQPHPIRGSFGDPRTVFRAPPTEDGVLRGDGSFAFHFGVDISAPGGTKVYPVISGVVSTVTDHWFGVDVGNGRVFQYWHITPTVRRGDHATMGKTVLGITTDYFQHLHFSELQNGRPVNPIRSGGLSPYADTTIPHVKEITMRGTAAGRDLVPNMVHGNVLLIAEAYDSPELAIPAPWNNMPVSPAKITWRIQRMTGRIVVRTQVARDVRRTIPQRERYWEYYARGTFQNMSVFGKHYSYGQPGCFLFKLTRSPFDTTTLRDGVYDLVVTVSDIAGNSSTSSLRFTIHNGDQ